jgi:hypothetical protein
MTVSGVTKMRTSDHRAHRRRRTIQNQRSATVTRGRRPLKAKAASCWRRARISSTRLARLIRPLEEWKHELHRIAYEKYLELSVECRAGKDKRSE